MFGRSSLSGRQKTFSLSKAQKGMRWLGVFHYLLGIMLLFFVAFIYALGPENVGKAVHEIHDPALQTLDGFDDWVSGMSIMTLVFIQAVVELFTGFFCRRNSTRPKKLLLTMLFSGFGILTSLFTILNASTERAVVLDTCYVLLLNLITFLLAFMIRKNHSGPPKETLK